MAFQGRHTHTQDLGNYERTGKINLLAYLDWTGLQSDLSNDGDEMCWMAESYYTRKRVLL